MRLGMRPRPHSQTKLVARANWISWARLVARLHVQTRLVARPWSPEEVGGEIERREGSQVELWERVRVGCSLIIRKLIWMSIRNEWGTGKIVAGLSLDEQVATSTHVPKRFGIASNQIGVISPHVGYTVSSEKRLFLSDKHMISPG